MKILVSSGGTKIPIDTVRDITNMSTGTFGTRIAEGFLRHGHEVVFVRARESKSPLQTTIDFPRGKGTTSVHHDRAGRIQTIPRRKGRGLMLRWFKKLFGRYDDYEECGTWGSFNTETGETTKGGKMYSRTIKVEKDDGSIALDTEWITDEDMEHEKATGEQVGPASDPPEDPTLKANWWK